MSSSSGRGPVWGEIRAVLRKELACELRARSGWMTAGLFGVVAVVAVGFAAFGSQIEGAVAAALLWVTLLFSAVVALPRAFVAEEESGTGDLLRLMARPVAVFWGKTLFNLIQMIVTGAFLSTLFLGLVGVSVERPLLFAVSLVAGCAGLAAAVTLCGALVAQASNRGALVGAVAIPLLLPFSTLAIGATKAAFGAGLPELGVQAAIGLVCYAVAALAIGPVLFAEIWKT